MKKLLLILLCLPFLFSSCKKEEEESPFVGEWSGTYSGTFTENASLEGSINANGDFNGTFSVGNNDYIANFPAFGTVTNNGTANIAGVRGVANMTYTINFNGEFNECIGSGTWSSISDSLAVIAESGTWQVNKQ